MTKSRLLRNIKQRCNKKQGCQEKKEESYNKNQDCLGKNKQRYNKNRGLLEKLKIFMVKIKVVRKKLN